MLNSIEFANEIFDIYKAKMQKIMDNIEVLSYAKNDEKIKLLKYKYPEIFAHATTESLQKSLPSVFIATKNNMLQNLNALHKYGVSDTQKFDTFASLLDSYGFMYEYLISCNFVEKQFPITLQNYGNGKIEFSDSAKYGYFIDFFYTKEFRSLNESNFDQVLTDYYNNNVSLLVSLNHNDERLLIKSFNDHKVLQDNATSEQLDVEYKEKLFEQYFKERENKTDQNIDIPTFKKVSVKEKSSNESLLYYIALNMEVPNNISVFDHNPTLFEIEHFSDTYSQEMLDKVINSKSDSPYLN